MVEENFQSKSTKTHQNEGFGVKKLIQRFNTLRIVEENFESTKTHRNEGF